MLRGCWFLCCLFVTCAVAQGAETRMPVPEQAKVTEATQLIADLYKSDYEKAKTPFAQATLAKKLVDDAIQSKNDPSGQFALFEIGRKMAIKSGDLDLSLWATKQQSDVFAIDRWELTRDALRDIAPLAKNTPARHALLRYLTVHYHEALRADRLVVAADLLSLGQAAARAVNDEDLLKQWKRRKELLATRTTAKTAAEAALVTLKTAPADMEANATAGAYRCLYLNDWQEGLPLLALGTVSPLQQAAEKDLRGVTNDTERITLADAWYDLAQAETDQAKIALLHRAEAHYLPAVATLMALPKRRVENRLNEIMTAGEPLAKNEWIELLDLVDLNKHTSGAGHWQRSGVALVTNSDDVRRVALPLVVDGSFELHIQTTRHSGPDQFHIDLSRAANYAGFVYDCMAGRVSSMNNINHKGPHDNGTGIAPANLPNGKPHLMSLYFDRKEDQAACVVRLDNKPYFSWTGAADSLKGGAKDNRGWMWLTTWKTDYVLHSARFRLKSGEAWIVE